MPAPAPAGGILSFVSPKESIERKGDPDAAFLLRSSLLNGVCEGASKPLHTRDASVHRPFRAIPSKSSGARRSKREKTRPGSQ